MSSDSDSSDSIIGPSPRPQPKQFRPLNIVMFRTRRQRRIEEIVISDESSDNDTIKPMENERTDEKDSEVAGPSGLCFVQKTSKEATKSMEQVKTTKQKTTKRKLHDELPEPAPKKKTKTQVETPEEKTETLPKKTTKGKKQEKTQVAPKQKTSVKGRKRPISDESGDEKTETLPKKTTKGKKQEKTQVAPKQKTSVKGRKRPISDESGDEKTETLPKKTTKGKKQEKTQVAPKKNTSVKGRKRPISDESEDEYSRTSEWVSQHFVGKRKKEPAQKTNINVKPVKKRKRKVVKCKICGKLQQNIWRHIKYMHKDEDPPKDPSLKNKVSKCGYILRFCPVKNCGAVVERLKDHLVRTHHIDRKTKSALLQRLMGQAKALTEKIESKIETVVKTEEKSSEEEDQIIAISSDESRSMSIKPVVTSHEISTQWDENDFNPEVRAESEYVSEKEDSDMFGPTQYVAQPVVAIDATRKDKSQEEEDDFTQCRVKPITESDKETDEEVDESEGEVKSEDDMFAFTQCRVKPIIESDKETEEEVDESEGEGKPDFGAKKIKIEVLSDVESIDGAMKDMIIDKPYYQNPHMKEFIRYLTDPPNLKNSTSAYQHAQQAYQIWRHVSPKLTIQGLLRTDQLNEWVASKLGVLAPGTLRSYLSSLTLFLNYLLMKRKTDDVSRCVGLIEASKILSRNLKKKILQRRTIIETEEIETMILPVDYQGFLQCDFSVKVQKQLKQPPTEIVPANFYDVRDFMLLRLLQTNAQRPMAVRNITTKSVERARLTDDGGADISVSQHKTSATHGPAILHLDKNLYWQLRGYLTILKRIPGYPRDSTRSIFTSWPKDDGTVAELTSSHVNKSIQRVWAQGNIDKRISATRMRKATSTAVRAAQPSARESLAKHMSHNPETADRHYALYKRQEMAKPMTELIASVMEGKKTPKQMAITYPGYGIDSDKTEDYDWQETLKSQQQVEENSGLEIVQKEVATQKSEQEEGKTKPGNRDQEVKQIEVEISNSQPTMMKHGRRSFSTEEAAELIAMCEEQIRSGNLSKINIMQKVTSTEKGRSLYLNLKSKIGDRDVWKIICDRLRTEQKKRRSQSLEK